METLLGVQTLSFPSFFSLMGAQTVTHHGPTTTSGVASTSPNKRGKIGAKPKDEEAHLKEDKHNRIKLAYGHYRWAEVPTCLTFCLCFTSKKYLSSGAEALHHG